MFLTFALLIVISTNTIEVNAVNTGFKTEPYPSEKANGYISNINILLIYEEPVKKSITCFDVNEHGMIAIGQDSV